MKPSSSKSLALRNDSVAVRLDISPGLKLNLESVSLRP